ncbi:uncharacterized protein [Antedon mediterranea]|uniref:uncharacterized protein n=1 Tax=Antedon mediterranea TaxID=105859 RepID=UPI003AF5049B
MDYSTDIYSSVLLVFISVFIIISALLVCATKGLFKVKNTGVTLVLESTVAEEDSNATIKCTLTPPNQVFSYMRWYRTDDVGKPIGDILAEIPFNDSNNEINETRENRRTNEVDLENAIYANDNRMSYRPIEDEAAYANVSPSVDEPVKSQDADLATNDKEDRMMKINTLKFKRGGTGLIMCSNNTASSSSSSSSSNEPVYTIVNKCATVEKKEKRKAPGYLDCTKNLKINKGKYKAFINEGSGGLNISNVKIEDSGNYTCYVFTTGLVTAKVSTTFTVAPKIVVSVDDVNAFEIKDRSVDIICRYTPKHETVSNMNWHKITPQGTKVFLVSSNKPCRSDRFYAVHSSGIGRLRIRDPVSGDEGCYECEVIRKSNGTSSFGDSVLTLPVRLFPYHRESSANMTSYRRPALVSFIQGERYHIIAFCEKRRRTATSETRSIVSLRGLVRSRTIEWEKQHVPVYSEEINLQYLEENTGDLKTNQNGSKRITWPENPVPIVVNERLGHIVVLFNKFTSGGETRSQRAPDWQLFSAHSTNGARTWSKVKQHFPWSNDNGKKGKNLTRPPPRHFELYTGHGIKLSTGTLIVNGFASKLESSAHRRLTRTESTNVLTPVILTGGKDGMEWRPICSGRGTFPQPLETTDEIDEWAASSLHPGNKQYQDTKNFESFQTPGRQAGMVSFKASLEDNTNSPSWGIRSSSMRSSKDTIFSVQLSKDGFNTWSKENLILKDGRVGSSDLAYFERLHPGSDEVVRMFACLYESVSEKDGTDRLTLVFNTFKLSLLMRD